MQKLLILEQKKKKAWKAGIPEFVFLHLKKTVRAFSQVSF